MGKKRCKNAFYFFFTELKDKQKQMISNGRAVQLASPLWNKMTPEQRRPYEEKAKSAKNNRVKKTCAGESVYDVSEAKKAQIQREVKVKTEIENMVKLANSDGSLADVYFHLFHMNIFIYREQENKCYPAEVALGKFNLRNGILKEEVYHSNVYPGKFPIGYKLTALQNAEMTHQLSTDFSSKNNIKEVLERLIDLNKENQPFFVYENDLFVVDKMIQDLCAEYEVDHMFNIYPLEYLFYVIKNMVHGLENKFWPAMTLGTLILEKDPYDMCEEIACEYHQRVERQAYCSKSKVIRWAYMICNHCTQVLSIQLIPGQHVPSNADVSKASLNNLTSCLSAVQIRRNTGANQGSKPSSVVNSYRNVAAALLTNVTSTAYDSDVSSYHGFEGTDSQAVEDEEEPWIIPKRTVRLRTNHHTSSVTEDNLTGLTSSQQSNQQSQSQSHSESLGMSTYLPGRRSSNMSEAGFRDRGQGRLQIRPE